MVSVNRQEFREDCSSLDPFLDHNLEPYQRREEAKSVHPSAFNDAS